VIGGLGGGPWLDGRVRLAHTAIGYAAKWIDARTETYGNAAKLALDAFRALIDDVRSGRQIKAVDMPHRHDRRHQDELRSHRRRPASADVRTSGLRCDAR